MPICLTLVSLLVLLLLGVELDDTWAAAIVVNIDNESRLSPITENKNINMTLLLLLVYTDRDMRCCTIICYVFSMSNKQFKLFIAKFCTIFLPSDQL